MSVQVNHYVILGTKIPYKDLSYEQVEEYCDSAFKPKKQGFVCLFDGMNGKYIFAGDVIASTENYEGFYVPIELDTLKEEHINIIKKELEQKLGLNNPEVKYWVVSHYR